MRWISLLFLAAAPAVAQPLGGGIFGAFSSTGVVTSITGTPNQIAVSASTGAVVISIPNNPTLPGAPTISSFANANHGHTTASSGGKLAGASALSDYSSAFVNSIAGTANQVIASASSGAVTLSLPQDIGTASTPTLGTLTLYKSVEGTGPTLTLNNPIGHANVAGSSIDFKGWSGASQPITNRIQVLDDGAAGYHMIFWTKPDSSAGALFEVMRIQGGTGNIGIKTASPTVALDVNGSTRFYDQTAVTGVTRSRWTPGAAQSTIPLLAASTGNALSFGINDTTYLSLTSAGVLTVANDSFIVTTAKTPASAADTCTTGQHAWDASYLYACTATNTWKRAAITTW